jgi:hypothetical protein
MTPEMTCHTNVQRRSPKIAQNEFIWAFSDLGQKIVPESSWARKKYQTFSMQYWEV